MAEIKYDEFMTPNGKKNKVILTTDTPFQNSQAIFLEYDDIIKCPQFVLAYTIKDDPVLQSIFDLSSIIGLDLEELFEWYENRKFRNIFMNFPMQPAYNHFNTEEDHVNFCNDLLKNISEQMPDIYTTDSWLNFAGTLSLLFDSRLVHDIYIYSEEYNKFIEDDIKKNYGASVHYVYGNLSDVLNENNVPRDSTYVFSDMDKVTKLKENGRLYLSSVIIADGFGYNVGKESIVEEYLNEVLFKIDYFDNNHKYQ